MDLLDLAILALRLALVALLYLFLLLVMRVAARGLQGSDPPHARDAGLQLLVVEAGGSSLEPGQLIDVGNDALVGRAGRAHIVLADPAVSAEHARLTRDGSGWVVTDLGSTNGTQVNEAPVQRRTRLHHGD